MYPPSRWVAYVAIYESGTDGLRLSKADLRRRSFKITSILARWILFLAIRLRIFSANDIARIRKIPIISQVV